MKCEVCGSVAQYSCGSCDTAYCSEKCQRIDWPKHLCSVGGEPQEQLPYGMYSGVMNAHMAELEFNTRNEDRLVQTMPLETFFWRAPSHREGVKPTPHMVFVYKNAEDKIIRDRVFWIPDSSSNIGHYRCDGVEDVGPLQTVSQKKKIHLGKLESQFAFAPLIGYNDSAISYHYGEYAD